MPPAVINSEECSGCGICLQACNVKAITLSDRVAPARSSRRYAVVSPQICLGCGACVSSCKPGVLALVAITNRQMPPLKRKELYVRILKEKKRLAPFVVSGIKKSLRSLFKGKKNKAVPIIKE